MPCCMQNLASEIERIGSYLIVASYNKNSIIIQFQQIVYPLIIVEIKTSTKKNNNMELDPNNQYYNKQFKCLTSSTGILCSLLPR